MIDNLSTNPEATSLAITWRSGETSHLPAGFLRKKARDAWTIRQKMDFGEVRVDQGLRITALHQVGPEGVNVHFSDGHERAIYPFVYLRELSDELDN